MPLAVLLLAAYPPLEWHGITWLALAPLIAGLRGDMGSPGSWLLAGWSYGLVFYAAQFAWLYGALVVLAGLPLWQFANFFALLVAGLALVPAGVFGLARWGWTRYGASPYWSFPLLLAGQNLLLGVFPFGGVAWGSLAGTQSHTVAARLLVPWIGAAGLVLLLGLVNAGWAWLIAGMRRRGARNHRCGWLAAAALLALTLLCAWPTSRLALPEGQASLKALLVPGALTLAELGAEGGSRTALRYYLGRTLAALERDAAFAEPGARVDSADRAAERGLVIWPESAVRGDIARGKTLLDLSRLGGLLEVDLLLGSNARVRGRDHNSLYLVNGGVFDFWRYDKRRLVPFGEYVPTGFRWLFGSKVTAGEADYAAGERPPVLDWRGHRLGVAICFESVLPRHALEAEHAGAEVLIVAANDAWLTPSGRRQHLLLSALRGLEVGRDVLFVSNRGGSAHLRAGGLLAAAEGNAPPMWVRAALRQSRTPWARWGYALLFAAMALVVMAGLALQRAAAYLRNARRERG